MTPDKKNYYYPYFDYLRISLAMVVMLHHDGLFPWQHSGNLAVQVFFALSGWLIGGILLRLSSADLPRFYFNRAVRIWIPYFLAFSLLIALSLLRDPIDAKWAEIVFYKFSFVYNIFGTPQLAEYKAAMPLDGTGSHFWSVNAEEQFYLIAPLLLVLAAARYGRTVLLWSLVALAAWITNQYASIAFGVLAAVVVFHHGDVHLTPAARWSVLGITATAALGMYAGFDYDLLAPAFSIGVVLLLAVNGPQNQIGKFLGGMSYPLYLNHWIGVFVGHALLTPFGLRDAGIRVLLSALVSLGIAAALYWWVDRRMLSMRGQMYSHTRAAVITVMAYATMITGIVIGMAIR